MPDATNDLLAALRCILVRDLPPGTTARWRELSPLQQQRFERFSREVTHAASRSDVTIFARVRLDTDAYAHLIPLTSAQTSSIRFLSDAHPLVLLGRLRSFDADALVLCVSSVWWSDPPEQAALDPFVTCTLPISALHEAAFQRSHIHRSQSWALRASLSLTPDGTLEPFRDRRTSFEDADLPDYTCTSSQGASCPSAAEGIERLRVGLANGVSYHLHARIRVGTDDVMHCGVVTGISDDGASRVRIISCTPPPSNITHLLPNATTRAGDRNAVFLDIRHATELTAMELPSQAITDEETSPEFESFRIL